MPIFSLVSKGKEIPSHNFRLRKSYKLKYLKLLHFHHNIDSQKFKMVSSDALTSTKPRLLFCKLSFLNLDQYEMISSEADGDGQVRTEGRFSYIVLGPSKYGTTDIISKDLFKVLTDKPFVLNQDIKVEYYYMGADGTMNKIKDSEVSVSEAGKPLTYANLVFEYGEYA